MPEKTVAQKAHVKPGATIAILKSVPGIVESLGLPDPAFVRSGQADLVFLFARTRADLEDMPRAVGRLKAGSSLWVFFRKGAKGAGLDMNRDTVWSVAEKLGLRPLGLLSVDETWSAFRFGRAEAGATAGGRAKVARRPGTRR